MKKIKRINLVKLSKSEEKELLGGCICNAMDSNFSNPSCCGGTDQQSSMYCWGYGGPPDPGSYDGGKRCDCSGSMCMPGDNVSFSSYVGTKFANEWI